MFYVAHRLFAAHDRILGASAARVLSDVVGVDDVFLPFCDTDEEDLVADVKGRRLFELDSERLKRLSGMLALLHGPSLDDGVCMEIGFAAALGVPVIALTTDFITYGAAPSGSGWSFPDPLVDHLVTDVISVRMLGPTPDQPSGRFADFEHRNRAQLDKALRGACQRLPQVSETARAADSLQIGEQQLAFVEPSPYRPSGDGDEIDSVLRELGYRVATAGRLFESDQLVGAATDWAAATSADLLVVDVSGPETPPGAAAMIGAATALGRTALAYNPVPAWTFAHGGNRTGAT